MDAKQIAIKGTTQEHLPIEDIISDLVILKGGSCCYVLETSSVNFDLLSEREQEAMIYAYAAIINSLTFPIQILIRSAIKDLSSYLKNLKAWESKAKNPLMKKQISHYRQFVTEVVEKNNVLAKSFYLAIPFSSFELGIESAKSTIPFFRKTDALPMAKGKIIEKAKVNLEPKKSHIVRVFARLGLKMRQLKTKELIALFHEIYNPDAPDIANIPLTGLSTPVVSYAGEKEGENG